MYAFFSRQRSNVKCHAPHALICFFLVGVEHRDRIAVCALPHCCAPDRKVKRPALETVRDLLHWRVACCWRQKWLGPARDVFELLEGKTIDPYLGVPSTTPYGCPVTLFVWGTGFSLRSLPSVGAIFVPP